MVNNTSGPQKGQKPGAQRPLDENFKFLSQELPSESNLLLNCASVRHGR